MGSQSSPSVLVAEGFIARVCSQPACGHFSMWHLSFSSNDFPSGLMLAPVEGSCITSQLSFARINKPKMGNQLA